LRISERLLVIGQIAVRAAEEFDSSGICDGVAERLMEAEEFQDFEPCYFERSGFGIAD